MKKLFGMIAIVLLFSSVVFAKSKLIQRDMIQDAFAVRTVCIDGYKFVISRNPNTRSMVQFFEREDVM